MPTLAFVRSASTLFLLLLVSGTSVAEQPLATAEQIAERLLGQYGHKLDGNSYIDALAVMGRQQAADRWGREDWGDEVRLIMSPYISGDKLPVIRSQSQFAGHIVFAQQAKIASTEDRMVYVSLLQRAADTLLASGKPLQVRPAKADEMSDAVFMCGPLLSALGALSDDSRYYDLAIEFLSQMRERCLRDDGLYRHSSLCDAAWGRGNGFPAIGVARCLDWIPEDHPHRDRLIVHLHQHLRALIEHQDQDGAWHQVIDRPDSYQEMSSTCMIGWTLQHGLSQGWFTDPMFRKAADRAWHYAAGHIGPEGQIDGVCEGTGKQTTVEAYLTRRAIRGRDDRGGAMALQFALARLRLTR